MVASIPMAKPAGKMPLSLPVRDIFRNISNLFYLYVMSYVCACSGERRPDAIHSVYF
jgi:hypothetical protein